MSARRLLAAVAVASLALSPAGASAASPAAHNVVDDVVFVERMLFDTSLKEFTRAAERNDDWYDWRTDGCSAPLVGDTGRSFDFRAPCERHDFGYRNLRRLEHRYGVDEWNATSRKDVDRQFLDDMRRHCRGRSLLLRPTCFAWAQTFYTAVRFAG